MDKFRLIKICLLVSTLALAGCVARTHNLKANRADQAVGNRGYITGNIPVSEKSKLPEGVKKPVVADAAEMDSVIAVFSNAIKKTPNFAGAYYNRAIAYFYKNQYEQSWQDVHKAESLGCKFSADFLASLKKASQREK